ncbi:glycosyltransferase family 2 protein [Phaeodactylibacter luteus]|uniref:Glycosyltransferase n=1 Tax=Phaeodactylibacter luteus TaxID=1564516 RepID=A0A5C6RNJ7_9BACT|nr:glycosyltransferase [Phaeodactylibacter luteus]TXB63803.1 glycosyltransferase [Phaeodactylibacter luteus]
MPRLSVVLPNYNYAKYLPQRIDSILGQSFQDFELLILDDASTDNSLDVIEAYRAKDSRIRVYPNRINSGSVFQQWRKGIELARSELIWIAEADDWSEHTFIEELLPFFEMPETVISFCQSNKTNETGVVTSKWSYSTDEIAELFKETVVFQGKELIYKALIYENGIPNASAVIFRKSCYEEVGGVDTNLKTNADWLLWLKLSCLGNVAFHHKPLNYFRRHENSVIANISASTTNYKEQFDKTMRIKFKNYLRKNRIDLPDITTETNNQLIALDRGNEALFLIQRQFSLRALFNLVKVSLQLRTLGFIRRALTNA